MQINLDTRNAPQTVVAKMWLYFHTFATLIASKVEVPKNCRLVWELKLLNQEEKVGQPACWEMHVKVAITGSACVGYHQYVAIPLIEVDEIGIMADGRVYWHGPLGPMQPGEDVELTERLVKSISTGHDGEGHQYVVQNFPHFERK